MVFNSAAQALIVKAGHDVDVVSHDWFIYQLITGAGGVVYYDKNPEILYRQHGANLIGSNAGVIARLSRLGMLLGGSFKQWNDRNYKALSQNLGLLTEENQDILNQVIKARKSSLFPRMMGFMHAGIYRQHFFDNLALFFSGVINKL
jgi:hypothetical protein